MNYFPWIIGGAALGYGLRRGRPRGARGIIEPPRKFIETVTDWYMRDPATQRRQLFTVSVQDTSYAHLLPRIKEKWNRQALRYEERAKSRGFTLNEDDKEIIALFRRRATGKFDVWVSTTDNLPPGTGAYYNMMQGIVLPTNASRQRVGELLDHESIHALQEEIFMSTFSRKGGGLPPSKIRDFDPRRSGHSMSEFEHMASDMEFYTRLYDTKRDAEEAVANTRPSNRRFLLRRYLTHNKWLSYLRRYKPGKYRRAVSELTSHLLIPHPEHKPRLPQWEKKEVKWYTSQLEAGAEPLFAVMLQEPPYTQVGAVFQRPSKKWGIYLAKDVGRGIPRMEKVPRKSWDTKREAVARVLEGQEGTYAGEWRKK